MKLPSPKELEIKEKEVLIRVDLDYQDRLGATKRQEALLETLDYVSKRAKKIILLGHKGRPGGRINPKFSLQKTAESLEEFLKDTWGEDRVSDLNMFVMENLRFNKGEEENSEIFAKEVAEHGDVYINEAFASSHRKHTSIVGLPKLLPHAAGFHFIKELKNLSKVSENPKRPVLLIVSGAKKDKLDYVLRFEKFADRVLIAGRLPLFVTRKQRKDKKLLIAELRSDKKDIESNSIEKFKREIDSAKTIVLVGPIGKFEDQDSRQGTKEIFSQVANSKAFKLAGGGDTQRAITTFDLDGKFDWISVGGGATLEFLAKGTLPGIQALLN